MSDEVDVAYKAKRGIKNNDESFGQSNCVDDGSTDSESRAGCKEFVWEVILKCRVKKWENKTSKSRETMKDVLTGGLLLEAPRAPTEHPRETP